MNGQVQTGRCVPEGENTHHEGEAPKYTTNLHGESLTLPNMKKTFFVKYKAIRA